VGFILNIQGLWAAGIFYYDAFEETYVGFSNTGLGFIYFMNPVTDHIELFKWNFTGEETITITGIKIYTFYDDELSEIEDSGTRLENLQVSKFTKEKITGEIIEAINFSQPISLNDSVFGLEDNAIGVCHKYKRIKELLGEFLPIEFNNL
jgi:hypothetical protein